jgi:uncharacterized protein
MKLPSFQLFLAIGILSFGIIEKPAAAQVHSIALKDVNAEDKALPSVGEKVLVILYLDPDVQGVDVPVSDSLDADHFPVEQVSVIGVVNCKDTWLPNSAIRGKARSKQERFPQSCILLDESRSLANEWKLGDCNNTLTLVVVGKDTNIRFTKRITTEDESVRVVPELIHVIQKAITNPKQSAQ